jgi:hypothetical protein
MRIEFNRNSNVDIVVYCEATMIGGTRCTAPSYRLKFLRRTRNA